MENKSAKDAEFVVSAKNIKLTRRLAAAAAAVRQNAKVADIGCDHGKLCVYLVQSERCGGAVAADINAKPLEKTRKLVGRYNLENRIETVLCDGLAAIDESNADDVVIAGLGFDVISKIISDCGWLKNPNKRLILVPSSKHAKLRAWLYSNGFEIIAETAVFDAGHCYTVITARYGGDKRGVSPGFAAVGKIKDTGDDARRYILKEYNKAKKLSGILKTGAKADEALEVVRYIEKEYAIDD